ncbi:unnamed protein product [Dibothriocephalus latus]|uniref:Uncharacterized protein n=1 Tax=Dibothriocephalus latus TaxID=60516 RepID=A0A3P7LE58_DIBLA|nr:unnamed protein product [Dibothriocephalus latus]
MFGTQYYDRRNGPKEYKPTNQWPTEVDPDDEVDYGFTKLPVRERRKLFMNDTEPPKIYQYGTLPRYPVNRRGSRLETQSEAGDWGPPIRRSLAPKIQTMPRPASNYGGQTTSHKTLELRNAQFSRQQSQQQPQQQSSLYSNQPVDAITQDYIRPTYAAPRQSRPISRSQIVSQPWPGDQQREQVITGTRVIPARKFSYSAAPRPRDTMSVGPEVMAPQQNKQSYAAPPVYIALSPRGRRPNSEAQFQQKSLTIYPSRTNTTQTRPYAQSVNDWTQPVRAAPVQNAAPMTPVVPQRNPRLQQSYNSPVARVPPRERQVVNRRAPPPDEDKGVSEF